jgi:hypothetical protein
MGSIQFHDEYNIKKSGLLSAIFHKLVTKILNFGTMVALFFVVQSGVTQ